MARSWINHPGEDDPWGQQRPSYWAGNGNLPRVTQEGPSALLLYRLEARARIDFTHVFAARNGVEHHLNCDRIILKAGKAVAAYIATGPLEAITKGPGSGIEYRNFGRIQGWAVIVAETDDVAAFTRYIDMCRLTMDSDGTRLTLSRPDAADQVLHWASSSTSDHDGYASAIPTIRIVPA